MTESSAEVKIAQKPIFARILWVDVAKGATILLVVLHHTIRALHEKGWALTEMLNATDGLQTFRMPLFFFASGMFFVGNLSKPWRLLITTRIAPLLYLYMVWTAIQGLFFWVLPWRPPEFGHVTDILVAPFLPTSVLWYVYALALYGLTVRLLNRLPLWTQAIIVFGISATFSIGLTSTGSWAWDSILSNFLFFFAAIHLGTFAKNAAKNATWWRFVTFALLWCVFVVATYLLNIGIVSPIRLPMSVIAIAWGIQIAALVAPSKLGQGLAWVGGRTLPIFVLHIFFVQAARHFLPEASGISTLMVAAAPVVVAILAVFGSFGVWILLRKIPGIFKAPWLP